jgi:ribosome-associated translation inhibitor RaiA
MARLNNLLARIEETLPTNSAAAQIETQAKNCFAAVNKLFDQLERQCSEEEFEELKKRFLNAVKSDDYRKFERGFNRVFQQDSDPEE